MATTCRANRCKIECSGNSCACIYVYQTDSCNCECFEPENEPSGGRFGLGTKVDISVNGLSLQRVAARLDGLVSRDVLLPAARANRKVRLKMTGVSVAKVIKTLGLRTQRTQR